MLYRDLLYGQIDIPDFVRKLFSCKEITRCRDISLSVLPQRLTPFGPMASRFHHNVGVMRLAKIICQREEFEHLEELLCAAGFLHDAGNPPFSHLSEYFLKEMFGKDGESFLEVILDGSMTEKLLRGRGLSVKEVVNFVTGKAKPYSDVLNGSVDIDNLDNVARYGKSIGFFNNPYDIIRIAESFRIDNNQLFLDSGIFNEVQKWKKARKDVYGLIYDEPHLVAAMMMYRAVELAYLSGNLTRDFFFLDDTGAINFLLSKCNKATKRLVEKSLKWQWYERIFEIKTNEPNDKIKEFSKNWEDRKRLANAIIWETKIPREKICVYTGAGKDVRRILLPFRGLVGFCDGVEEKSIYRIKIYIDSSASHLKQKIIETASRQLGLEP